MKIKIDSDDDLPLKILHIHNVLMLIKSDFNETYKHYYYQVFLENISYELLI